MSVFFDGLKRLGGAVWLDSCAHGTVARYDVITASPYQTIVHEQGQTYSISDGIRTKHDEAPLQLLERFLPKGDDADAHPSFTHGAIGYVGYEYGLTLQGISGRHKSGLALPDVYFGLYDWSIVIDHHERTATLGYLTEQRSQIDIEKVSALWDDSNKPVQDFKLLMPFMPMISKASYHLAFDKIKAHLIAGNTYQVNLSHRFQAPYTGGPFQAYCYLRQINPMPYASFMQVNDEAILSFSPELFFKAADRYVTTQPIKGTIRRERDMAQDQKAKSTLSLSEKDRAENTMIVDLLRNDLSQVCQPFSVKVPVHCELQTFTTVHHLVSTVIGELQVGSNHFDLFRALFPCGSITGAPKHETMKIIDVLEPSKRHVYCGSMGYFSANGKTAFNVAIRTLMTNKQQLYCSGGGGIVLDSDKDKEYEETLDKISVLTEALGRCKQDETFNI